MGEDMGEAVVQERAYETGKGRPYPLGVSKNHRGLNFALYSKYATRVILCLYHPLTEALLGEIQFDPQNNQTGDVWHISVQGLPNGVHYSYRIDGRRDLIDPYAKALASPLYWGQERGDYGARAVALLDHPFDWEGIAPPAHKMTDLVLYEMHVRGFTQDPSSNVAHPGTFAGMMEKIPYLQDLGVNAVELLPIFEFDECSYRATAPKSKKQLYNYWGYGTLNFFTPMGRYACGYAKEDKPVQVLREFKTLVRELHRAGIEVILDVVYNHTGENCFTGPSISFRGIDAITYYILARNGDYCNYSGCGNTLNCNHPVTTQLILESLRYWVSEMHVDGFRFDLASIMTRNTNGTPMEKAPLIEAISADPVLSKTKLIAEPWDAAGLYQVGEFPKWGRWSEWNGKYRDTVRRFLRGDEGQSEGFASALLGSETLYDSPISSINFVTCHDGFTLKDLVSFSEKHNLDNGEENRDGSNGNESWNCGTEGPTRNKKVIELRNRQMRNFLLALMVSQGIPMLHMGDEYGHTKKGNNNTWCHDDELSHFQWKELKKHDDLFRFCKELIAFRKTNPLLRQKRFLDHKHLVRQEGKHFAGLHVIDNDEAQDLYIAFNGGAEPFHLELPHLHDRRVWCRIVDTSLPSPQDVTPEAKATMTSESHLLPPHSALLLKALPRK